MGHSSKKKKRGGGSRKGKGKAPSKDHPFHANDDPDLLSEEITALCAIFQEDIKLISDSPVIQPYSTDMDSDDSDISALLSVRCLPGYPFKCPKLRIIPERGLLPDDADKLLSLLVDQANINSREGRVMVFNLVEVAQEFLSEISPVLKPADHVQGLGLDNNQWLHDDLPIVCDHNCSSSGPFTYGLVDLFSDLCGDVGSWEWSIGTNAVNPSFGRLSRNQVKSRDDNSPTLANSLSAGCGDPRNHPFQNPKPVPMLDIKGGSVSQPVAKFDVVKEETEDDSKSTSPTTSDLSLREQSLEKGSGGDMHGDSIEKVLVFGEKTTESDDSDSEGHSLDAFSFVSSVDQEKSKSVEQDLVMIISKRVRDLATMPTLDFNKAFNDAFRQYMVSSPITQFWKANADSGGEKTSSHQTSRYLNDFEEISSLGHGGFGHVVLCKNKLDGRQYAVKKIRLKDKSLPVNEKILR
ncbi:hypothetical protein ACLOJK_008999 [Asimina triloba]